MEFANIIALASIIMAGITIAIGTIAPAIAEGRAIVSALESIAQQPDATPSVTRALFVGLAMIESIAIYCLVISMIIIFANPFWNFFISKISG